MGRCLQPVANRPPAKQLLTDPFLASDHGRLMSPATPNGTVEKTPSFQTNHSKRSTDMMITGTINPEDHTIFLKVTIFDNDGISLIMHELKNFQFNNCPFRVCVDFQLAFLYTTGVSRNIYFPFDIGSDTAMEVATEMVKELEITDWEPSEIAKMIEEEIFALIPSWKEWAASPENNRHSFVYEEDDDDDERYHPFCSYASGSPSRDSLQDLSISCENQSQSPHGNLMTSQEDWFQGKVHDP